MAKTFVGYKPLPWQIDVHKALIEHKNKTTITVLSRRQCGKSAMAANILLERAINVPGSVGIYVAPTFKQCRKFFGEVYQAIAFSKVLQSWNKSDFEFTLINGSKIVCLSAAQKENLRGYTVKHSYLVIDEGAFIADGIYDIVQPYTNVYRANTIIISTPLFTAGKFFECYQKGLSKVPGYVTIDWNNYDTSALLDSDLLEQYRINLPENTFKTEYLGQFIKGGGLVFKNFVDCIYRDINLSTQTPKYVGIDWATGQGTDFTIITYMTINGIVTKQSSFKNMSPSTMIKRITDELNSYSGLQILAEKNSIGEVYASEISSRLTRGNIMILFNTSNSSKKELIESLIMAFDSKKIQIPDDEILIRELEVFSSKYSVEKRLLTYGAPLGMNDDRVISLALCWKCKGENVGVYCVS